MSLMEAIVSPFLGCRWWQALAMLTVFYVGFCAAILAHELGHYAAARVFGIVPEAVRVGHFGPKMAFSHAGTRFIIRLFANPLGAGVTTFHELKTSYLGISIILMAGIAVNVLMGVVLLCAGVRLQSATALVLALASVSVGIGQLFPAPGADGHTLVRIILGKAPSMRSAQR